MFDESFEHRVYTLSEKFYTYYNAFDYPELLHKKNRPYNCLVLETRYDYYMCIPYRTNIKHSNAFKFKKSERSRTCSSGLDYSKMVIIQNSEYIGEVTVIDDDEFEETVKNVERIAKQADEYIEKYIDYVKGVSSLSLEALNRKYKYTTLKYFHNELGISE